MRGFGALASPEGLPGRRLSGGPWSKFELEVLGGAIPSRTLREGRWQRFAIPFKFAILLGSLASQLLYFLSALHGRSLLSPEISAVSY